ncbi:MAG: MBL fold metallo-hydrolase [Balneolales bacterium]|nr:MBL fold metallo-hydrolase [Balneolales bacterium]
MYFKQFFDPRLAQYAYLIGCQKKGTAVVIDPMRDIDQYIEAAAKENLEIIAAADTHIHADYISGLREFAERGVKVYASDEGDKDWKYEWLINSDKYDYQLLKDGDTFNLGNIKLQAWHTPGHTPEHLSYLVTDGAAGDEPMGIATGDFVFVGDVGRPDLLESAANVAGMMEPSARTLFGTVEKFKQMPEYLQIWPGHGSGSACGKALGAVPETTVGYELRFNKSIKSATSEDNFVKFILEGQPEPPLYFARMKRDNKIGPAVAQPANPARRGVNEIDGILADKNTVVLDTRERNFFAEGHFKGSLLSPLNKAFNTVAGSYITEEQQIVLVADEDRVTEAVLDLYRIGLDKVTGFITPEDLNAYGKLETLEVRTFATAADLIGQDGTAILDVRKASEYDEEGYIEGAVNIAHTRLLPRKGEVPTGKKLVVHCQAGGRSAVAAAFLKREGFDVVLVDDNFENYKTGATV